MDVGSKRESRAPGEVMEFRVWAELIDQSGGALHISSRATWSQYQRDAVQPSVQQRQEVPG